MCPHDTQIPSTDNHSQVKLTKLVSKFQAICQLGGHIDYRYLDKKFQNLETHATLLQCFSDSSEQSLGQSLTSTSYLTHKKSEQYCSELGNCRNVQLFVSCYGLS